MAKKSRHQVAIEERIAKLQHEVERDEGNVEAFVRRVEEAKALIVQFQLVQDAVECAIDEPDKPGPEDLKGVPDPMEFATGDDDEE